MRTSRKAGATKMTTMRVSDLVEHVTAATYDDVLQSASVSCPCGWAKVVPHARKTAFARATAIRLAGAFGRAHEADPEERSE